MYTESFFFWMIKYLSMDLSLNKKVKSMECLNTQMEWEPNYFQLLMDALKQDGMEDIQYSWVPDRENDKILIFKILKKMSENSKVITWISQNKGMLLWLLWALTLMIFAPYLSFFVNFFVDRQCCWKSSSQTTRIYSLRTLSATYSAFSEKSIATRR